MPNKDKLMKAINDNDHKEILRLLNEDTQLFINKNHFQVLNENKSISCKNDIMLQLFKKI